MQTNRVIYSTLIAILRNKPTRRSIHITGTQIVKPRTLIKLLTAITIAILCRACGFQQITKSIIAIDISYSTILISKSNNRAMSVINIYRHLAVTFLRNEVSANRIDTLRRAVFSSISARTLVRLELSLRYFTYSVTPSLLCVVLEVLLP